jgi:hypothetical protein
VDSRLLATALLPEEVEALRPLLPMGYRVVADAYRAAVEDLNADDLSHHYLQGRTWLRQTFGPALVDRLGQLSGGEWDLRGWKIFAAGSDADFITHIIEAAAANGPVRLYPNDWYGFLVGATHDDAISFEALGAGDLACLCIPSVRNGHLTNTMVDFLGRSPVQLLNINLFPTLAADERHATARALRPLLPTSLLSVSFSRGFGLTASQLGVLLVPPDHPWTATYQRQWDWYSYFYNTLAAKAFLAIDLEAIATVDRERRRWTTRWLTDRGLPDVETGSYYVRSFRPDGPVAEHLRPLVRDGVLRCCLKPTPT